MTFTIGTNFSVSSGTLSLTADDFPFTSLFPPAITGGTLSTSSTGILLVNAVAGDAHSDEFDINSAVSLGGTTTIASNAFLALGGGGSLGGTIGGSGEVNLGDMAYTAKAATFAASLASLDVEGNGSLALSGPSGTIAAAVLLADTGTISIASGIAITSSNYLQVGVNPLVDYQYDSVLSGPGTFVTAGVVSVEDSFITAIGNSSADTLTALATSQTLTGGAGADILNGYSGGNDSFADTAAGLNLDTINNWTTGDVMDITNIAAANLHPLTFGNNTLTATDGTTSTAIKFAAGEALGNFTVLGTDSAGTGALIGFHA